MKASNIMVFIFAMFAASCERNPCSQLGKIVCEKAPATPACERASRTTHPDECQGFLEDIERFIALANERIDTPVLQPPKREQPEAETTRQQSVPPPENQ